MSGYAVGKPKPQQRRQARQVFKRPQTPWGCLSGLAARCSNSSALGRQGPARAELAAVLAPVVVNSRTEATPLLPPLSFQQAFSLFQKQAEFKPRVLALIPLFHHPWLPTEAHLGV